MCKLPVQIQAESSYHGWHLHRISLLVHLEVLTSRTLENITFLLYFFLWKKQGLDIFHWFVFCFFFSHPLTLRHLHVAFWQIQVYDSCWFFCLLEEGFCLWKIWLYLFMGTFNNYTFFFFSVPIAHLVGQSDTVLTHWPKELLPFQLAGLFSKCFPWLLGHVTNFIELPCFSQNMGTFCWESEVCPLYVLFILHLRSSWGRISYITS